MSKHPAETLTVNDSGHIVDRNGAIWYHAQGHGRLLSEGDKQRLIRYHAEHPHRGQRDAWDALGLPGKLPEWP